MAAAGDIEALCEEATCPVCLEFFTNPVTVVGCGHNFCRACLSRYWGNKEEDAAASCPQCREAVPDRSFIPNRPLANFVEITKKLRLRGQGGGAGEAAEGVCEKHQEPLKLFCKDHRAPLCVVCDRSKEHESHKVVPREEAFQEYKMWSRLKNLRTERDKILTYKTDAERESRALLNQTEAERQKTRAVFQQIRQFLEEQEKSLLVQVEVLEKEIARRRDVHVARLSEELSSLEKVIREMEEKCRQPASEFLQDVGRTLQRSVQKKAFKNPVAFPPELTCRIRKFYDVKPLLERVMKQFPALAANVTLDPETANPRLILSEGGKSVRWGNKRQDLPNNPERFVHYAAVLGREGFTSGRHFWEVTVPSEGTWAVGVARKSVRRKGVFDFSPEEGIWALGKWRGQYRVLTAPDRIPLSLGQELKRIRVTLNCAEGQVGFFDADSGVHLYTFSGASFCRETLLPFFRVYGKAHLKLSP